MHQIDLMPKKCKDVLGRRLWLRRWAIGYAFAIVALIGVSWFTGAGADSKATQRDTLAAVREIKWQQNEEAQTLAKEIEDLERRIERHNRLAWPVRVSEVIDTVASVMPEGVTLLSLTCTERQETIEGARGKSKKETPTARSILITELEGVAPDDTAVAEIVQGLQVIPLFRAVVLDFARNSTVDGTEARAFRISCETDLSKKYRFVDLAEVPGDG